MSSERRHIVRSYDQELRLLRAQITELGNEAGLQLEKAIRAFRDKDLELAHLVVEGDSELNSLQRDVDSLTLDILSKRQPLAQDLRMVIAGQKMASDLERIADYASTLAKYTIRIDRAVPSLEAMNTIIDMGGMVGRMLQGVMEAFQDLDMDRAVEIWLSDQEVDETYSSLIMQLHELMASSPERIKGSTSLLLMGRCCERIGDHVKNLAEQIRYIACGDPTIEKVNGC
jgi:phosphate transport system protein